MVSKSEGSDEGMKRFHQVLLIASLLPLAWLGMMVVHEFGHVLGAWLTGGTVEKVVLHPLTISRTDVRDNPEPLFVVWAGPLIGVLLPLAAWWVARFAKMPGTYLLRFFAGICLVGNGLYLGVGSFDKIGDAGDLLRHGAAIWQLWAFGAITVPLGFYLWHKQGPHFGLGTANGRVDPVAAYICSGLLVVVVVLEVFFGGE